MGMWALTAAIPQGWAQGQQAKNTNFLVFSLIEVHLHTLKAAV